MSTLKRSFEVQHGIVHSFFDWIAFFSQKGIVAGVDQVRGDRNISHQLFATAFTLVIVRVFETVKRRRVSIIESLQLLKSVIIKIINFPWHDPGQNLNFSAEGN